MPIKQKQRLMEYVSSKETRKSKNKMNKHEIESTLDSALSVVAYCHSYLKHSCYTERKSRDVLTEIMSALLNEHNVQKFLKSRSK